MKSYAILVAAGRGERLGRDRPKAFLALGGQTLLQRSALAFDRAPSVAGIVAVVPAGLEGEGRAQLAGLGSLHAVVAGGDRRQDSVRAGLAEVPPGFEGVVLVHDAARPFVDEGIIEGVVAAASDAGAALPVVPIVDTVKRVHLGEIVETLDRAELGAAQTPQGFRLSVLTAAYAAAYRDGATVTDEAMAVERHGGRVMAVPGQADNRKITTPEDWAWAERHLLAMESAR